MVKKLMEIIPVLEVQSYASKVQMKICKYMANSFEMKYRITGFVIIYLFALLMELYGSWR